MCVCVQINCVVMKGLNDDEICDFVALTENKVRVQLHGNMKGGVVIVALIV